MSVDVSATAATSLANAPTTNAKAAPAGKLPTAKLVPNAAASTTEMATEATGIVTKAGSATTTAAPGSASAPIPFRKTAATSGPEVLGTLAVTLLVLAGFAALAWYARSRGWLDRWITQGPSAAAGKRKLSVIEVLHVSRKTTLFRLSDGEREFLLTESSVQAQLGPLQIEGTQA